MEDVKCYKNIKSDESKIIAYSTLSLFILAFIYLEWFWLVCIYILIILVVTYMYMTETKVLEVIIDKVNITIIYKEKFNKKTISCLLADVKVEKRRNAVFKFSEVYDLKISIYPKFEFLLEGQMEFLNEDILDIYERVNNKNNG